MFYSTHRQQSEGQEGTEILEHAWDMLTGEGAAWAPVLPLPPRGPWQQVTKGNAWLLTTHTHTHKFRQTDSERHSEKKSKERKQLLLKKERGQKQHYRMTTLCSQVHSGHFTIKSGEYISFVLQNIKQLTQFSTICFLVVIKLFMM